MTPRLDTTGWVPSDLSPARCLTGGDAVIQAASR